MCTSELKIFVSGGSVSEAIADHTIMNNTRGFWYPNDLAIDYVTPFLLDALDIYCEWVLPLLGHTMQHLGSWQCFIFQLNLEDDPALLLKSDQFIESGEKNAREDVGSFYYLINVITNGHQHYY